MSESSENQSSKPADPFTSYWAEFMRQMGMGGMAGGSNAKAGTSEPDFVRQMRDSFFQAMARSCDEFMRSEQFLQMMKQTMENALAFRQQMNRFLSEGLHSTQAPAREDTDHILLVLRSMEERVLRKLDGLEERVEALESSPSRESRKSTPSDSRKASASPKSKSAKRSKRSRT